LFEGRPFPRLLSAVILGIEIGGTKLQLVLGERDGTIHQRFRFKVAREAAAEGIRRQIAETLVEIRKRGPIEAVGIGFGGPVNCATGRIARSHQVEGWSDYDLTGWLTGLAEAPVFADNDANVAALGEAVLGAGKGSSPVFYVTLGSGVGGGLVVDGRIYHGRAPGEAEIGHVRLDKAGTRVEDRCSGWAMDRRIREAVSLHPGGPLAALADGATEGEARFLAGALEHEDPVAYAILSEFADNLAFGLSHVVQLLHPERIILGGGLSLVGEPLRSAVAAALGQYVMEVFGEGSELVLATLKEDAVTSGALLLAGQGIH
jgi:glucokinase